MKLTKLVPEGIEGRVAYKGAVADIVFQILVVFVLVWVMLVLKISQLFMKKPNLLKCQELV